MGPEGLRNLIAERLATRAPAILAALERELALAPGTLAAPSLLAPIEARLLAVDDFPAYLVTLLDAPTLQVIDWGPPTEVRLETTTRVLAFARDQTYEAAGIARDRYMLALRRCLLGERYLGRPDAGVILESYRESYSEVGADRSARSIAAAFAEFRVFTHERLPAP